MVRDIKVDNSSFMKAIWTVLLADFTMSLDNVLGVAGAAGDHYVFTNFWFSFINNTYGNSCYSNIKMD